MLTDLIAALPVPWAHRLAGWLGVELDTLHDWLPGMCPCGAGYPTITATLERLA